MSDYLDKARNRLAELRSDNPLADGVVRQTPQETASETCQQCAESVVSAESPAPTSTTQPNDQTTNGVEQARQYAPDRPCAGCGLRMWWQRPDGAWICAICPDPVKCRWCDRPRYSHESWPMVCDRWEPKPIPQGRADVKPLDAA